MARGRRAHGAAFTVQANRRAPETGTTHARIGFTVTKKVGTATERNRIRRRLRAAVRTAEALPTDSETDYVVVARREALAMPFDRLVAELDALLRRSRDRSGPRRRRGAETAT